MSSISETVLFQLLEKRAQKRDNVHKYLGVILSIEKQIAPFLAYQKIEFGDYPDHSIEHSIRIIENMGMILGEQKSEKLSSTEIFCFILAAIFHDTGMSLAGYDSKNILRSNHPRNAAIVIDAFFDHYMQLLENEKRIRNVIKYICAAHGADINELYNGREFYTVDTIAMDKVRFGTLAVMLRIGDLLDLDENRVSKIAILLLPEIFSEEAISHNQRHMHVTHCRIDPEHLEVTVDAPDVSQYRIWKKWLGYLDEEIRFVNNEIANSGDGITYPKLVKSITTANGNYDIEDLKFEIDENGGIFEIISNSIYTDKFDFVREIIQNAIDASLMVMYSDISNKLEKSSPRAWGLTDKKFEILICYSKEQEMLFVLDCGIGMDDSDLKKFLFKISSTGYKKNRIRDFPFPSIAKFGIGFISCLINAKTIKIYTSKGNNSPLRMVTLESGLTEALMETVSNTSRHGTIIAIKVKKPFSFRELSEYIFERIKYPSVSLSLINLDLCNLTCKGLGQKGLYDAILQKPFTMKEGITSIIANRERAIIPLNKKVDEYQRCIVQCNDLLYWLKTNLDISSNKPDSIKMEEFREKVKEITLPREVQHEFPFRKRLNQREFFNNPYDQETACSSFIYKLREKKGYYQNERAKYPDFYSFICNEAVEPNDDWKYLVCYLGHDLKIINARISNDPIVIRNEMGLIFLKHSFTDYSCGIEYSAVNGFLFKDGLVQKRLSVMTGYHTILGEAEPRDISFEIGAFGLSKQDLWDSIEEWKGLQEFDSDSEVFYNEENQQDLRIDPSFQTIYICDDGIHFGNDEIDAKALQANNIEDDGCEMKLYCGSPKSGQSLFSSVFFEQDNYIDLKGEVDRVCSLNNLFFQDGIAVDIPLSWLFPNGFFRITCNLTADARVKLNVSRHEPSRLDSDVEAWFAKVGLFIQNTVYKNVIEMLDNVHLKHTFTEELVKTPDDPFMKAGLNAFRELTKKEKQFYHYDVSD